MISLVRHPLFFYTPKISTPSRAMATKSTYSSPSRRRKLPILLFDVMDTIVRDPFYHAIPAFFQVSMKELLESKHPTAWIEFEKGLINEDELAKIFFKDGRSFDLEGLKECMVRAYSYVEGVEELLCSLKLNNYEMHAFTNYPVWYMMIEEKLKLSKYLSWTFCSCISGKRKPDLDFYTEVSEHLGVEPARCIFIDDRMVNVEAATQAGMVGLQFKNAESLKQDLSSLGVELVSVEDS
ncbi:flavin mononucleotide hydrolase 1, chloroplatic [Typha angustifolia]|uniref:flavin mononucleotide hydrolase 1, chloroplatic n=1 Tax=Typha angustifolia TaxID=59011 RepID=UPI003C2D8269